MASLHEEEKKSFDVLVIGAGISGINAAFRIQEQLPWLSYGILESRHELGGTWSLFNYPGIRSDSDLHTFGFPWDPWIDERAIADGPSILAYMKRVASKHGIDRHIKFNHEVQQIEWSSKAKSWSVTAKKGDDTVDTLHCQYIYMSTGLYDYHQGLPAVIPGIENFGGDVLHPQFWPADFSYENKRIVIIGSGATAVTLLPTLAEKAKKVTMLQRNPGYYYTIPAHDPVDAFIRRWCPTRWLHRALRWKYIIGFFVFFQFALNFPEAMKKHLRKLTEPQLPERVPFAPHFTPSYKPWEQRMCITPQGDFFKALRDDKADVVTDHIQMVDHTGIVLKSGSRLDCDVIITATGLQMLMFGNAKIIVDGVQIDHGQKLAWRATMVQDIPNFAFSFGYTNASWTLGADISILFFMRIVKEVQKRGMQSAVPILERPGSVKPVPWLDLRSNYVLKAIADGIMPMAGDVAPWKPKSNYLDEYWKLKWVNVDDCLKFSR